jgi:SacI restriction endonuclease
VAKEFSGEAINGALSAADVLARTEGESLVDELPEWNRRLDRLIAEQCPRTYLPVLCVTLVARMLSPSVNVLKIQKRGEDDAYSAPSIGSKLIPFTTSQGINLRSASTQVLNNQPFTFKREITADLTDNQHYPKFFTAASAVQTLTTTEAKRVLALAFYRGRQLRGASITLGATPATNAWSFRNDVLATVAKFVSSHTDGGRVGQAFGAAMMDVLYGSDLTTMKKINDPSFSAPGDFTVGQPIWLSGEAKQTVVTIGTVKAFADACLSAGIHRAIFLALSNAPYPDNISNTMLAKQYDDKMQLSVFTSAADACQTLLVQAPLAPMDLANSLVSRLLDRMQEIGCDSATIQAYVDAMKPHGFAA